MVVSRFYVRGLHHHGGLRVLTAAIVGQREYTVTLVPETANANDPNAVRIDVVPAGDRTTSLGYVPREVAPALRRLLQVTHSPRIEVAECVEATDGDGGYCALLVWLTDYLPQQASRRQGKQG